MKKKVLLTGATGTIGQIILNDLQESFVFTATSRHEVDRDNFIKLDISNDSDTLTEIVAQHDAVCHMAYIEESVDELRNFQMTKNICHAAIMAPNRPRLVLASSIHADGAALFDSVVQSGSASEEPSLRADELSTPNGFYGALKCYIEAMGRFTAWRGIETVLIRFGGVRLDDSRPAEEGYERFFLSRRDCAGFVNAALSAELKQKYSIVNAISDNSNRLHDLTEGQNLIGYTPVDSVETTLS